MKAIKIENEAQYDIAKQWVEDKGIVWNIPDWSGIFWLYVGKNSVEWNRSRSRPILGYKTIPFDELFKESSKKLSFPFSIQCRDLHERDAAAAWLISHGCWVHGKENHLNGEYKESFHKSYLTLYVGEKTYFAGGFSADESDLTFFENVSKFSKLFKEEIKVGDWVVALKGQIGNFTKGKIYKVVSVYGNDIRVQSDDEGIANVWGSANFRKVRPDEIPQLPKINGYSGEIKGDIVKYGCAEISLAMLRKMNRVMNEKYSGNRTISKIILDSGATISKVEIEQILKAAK